MILNNYTSALVASMVLEKMSQNFYISVLIID